MAAAADDPDGGSVHLPRERVDLVGHEEAERALLQGFGFGRLHHAWLIGGPEGIGKATLAYRFARFLLAQSGQGPSVPPTMAVPPEHPAARQVAALSHPNLLVLDPALLLTEKKEPARTISVEAVRRVVTFLGSTASDGGYRVCIIDSAEDLTNASANALLKAIEEPPQRAVFLIVSHMPQRIMPTIRSRCRKLTLKPLGEADLRRVIATSGDAFASLDEEPLSRAVALADGSVSRAIEMLEPAKAALIEEVTGLLDALPQTDTKRVLDLADKLALRQGDEAYALALQTVRRWLSAALTARLTLGVPRLAPLAEFGEHLNETARSVDVYNLDRRPFVISLFSDLAAAVRRAA